MDWHDLRDPGDPELDQLAARHQLHALHVEDCRHRNQAAKIEENPGYLFVVLKPVEIDEDGNLEISDLDLFVGRDFLITVQEGGRGGVARLLEQVRAAWGGARADQLLYRITDAVVDSYLPVLDRFSDTIDELEDQVLDQPTPQALERIHDTKRGLIVLRRVLVNTRDVAGHLLRAENDLVAREMWPFLRDLYDHLARNLDMVETQRDLLNGALDIYLSSVANRTNQVVKVLTVLGTVALPALVISGLYGMNLEGLPWKGHPHGFAIVSGMVAAVSGVFLAMLKLFHWL
jgi:magnesium transporter